MRRVDWGAVVAAYAAVVSTTVAVEQYGQSAVLVRVQAVLAVTLDGGEILQISVLNMGRRHVEVDTVAYVAKGQDLTVPPSYTGSAPFQVNGGERHRLNFLWKSEIPKDAVFLARDGVGHWWPRRRRALMKIRQRQAKHG